jgi:hypothetical protein
MIRRASFWLSLLTACALAPVFTACAGTTDGLFSNDGGAPNNSGTGAGGWSSTAAGSNTGGAHAGGSAAGGTGAASGSSASGGSGANGGAGAASGAGNAGGSNAGAGGSSSGAGGASAGGSSSGAGGNAGTSSGGNAGTSSGGSGGANCQELLALAESELIAAQACDLARNVQQCTGSVSTVCGCQVPVEANDTAATRSYLATLKTFRDQHCVIACSKIACLPSLGGQCQPLDSGDRCVARVGATTQ